MLFAALMGLVLAVTVACVALLLPLCVGLDRIRSVASDRDAIATRAVDVAPFFGGLGVVLLVNKGIIRRLEAFSFEYGYRATTAIYAIEGDLVAAVQDALPEWGVYYFGPMYVVGYVVLVAFPVVAYAFADTLRPLKRIVTAYAVNYAMAMAFYAGVLAYGPRSYGRVPGADPNAETVEPLLLDYFSDVTRLTARVNVETNVFPSLHTALSVTVLLVAVSTHEEFPRWTPVAGLFAGSIVLATMFLGIHWAVDVAAGGALAAGSVAAANRIVS